MVTQNIQRSTNNWKTKVEIFDGQVGKTGKKMTTMTKGSTKINLSVRDREIVFSQQDPKELKYQNGKCKSKSRQTTVEVDTIQLYARMKRGITLLKG